MKMKKIVLFNKIVIFSLLFCNNVLNSTEKKAESENKPSFVNILIEKKPKLKNQKLNDQFISFVYLGPSKLGITFGEFEKLLEDAIKNPNIDINATGNGGTALKNLIISDSYVGENGPKERLAVLRILLSSPRIDVNKNAALNEFAISRINFGNYAPDAMISLLSKGAKWMENEQYEGYGEGYESNFEKFLNNHKILREAYEAWKNIPEAPQAPRVEPKSKADEKRGAEEQPKPEPKKD